MGWRPEKGKEGAGQCVKSPATYVPAWPGQLTFDKSAGLWAVDASRDDPGHPGLSAWPASSLTRRGLRGPTVCVVRQNPASSQEIRGDFGAQHGRALSSQVVSLCERRAPHRGSRCGCLSPRRQPRRGGAAAAVRRAAVRQPAGTRSRRADALIAPRAVTDSVVLYNLTWSSTCNFFACGAWRRGQAARARRSAGRRRGAVAWRTTAFAAFQRGAVG